MPSFFFQSPRGQVARSRSTRGADGSGASKAPPGTTEHVPRTRTTSSRQLHQQASRRAGSKATSGAHGSVDWDDGLGESASQLHGQGAPGASAAPPHKDRASADAIRAELARHFELLQAQVGAVADRPPPPPPSWGRPQAAPAHEDQPADREALHRELADLEGEFAALAALDAQQARR